MQKIKFISPSIIVIIFSLIGTNMVAAQPPPESFPSPVEICYGYVASTVEFVCKDENLHFRSIDCDEVNQDIRGCVSAECTITKGNNCSMIHEAYIHWSNDWPQCDHCTSVFAPVYDH